jgi:hypothetical protein
MVVKEELPTNYTDWFNAFNKMFNQRRYSIEWKINFWIQRIRKDPITTYFKEWSDWGKPLKPYLYDRHSLGRYLNLEHLEYEPLDSNIPNHNDDSLLGYSAMMMGGSTHVRNVGILQRGYTAV